MEKINQRKNQVKMKIYVTSSWKPAADTKKLAHAAGSILEKFE